MRSTGKRILGSVAGVALWLLVFGFIMFATQAMRQPARESVSADAIVVLTGGQTRIAEGARLLESGHADRMLISGVNRVATREEIFKLSGLSAARFDCCVDLGYAALDTIGNAEETRRWAEAKDYDSLIVVTAGYHMPRSMAELARVMPRVRLIAHPVLPDTLRQGAWWLNLRTTRMLVSEYLKFLPSAARYGVARMLSPWDRSSLASMRVDRAKL